MMASILIRLNNENFNCQDGERQPVRQPTISAREDPPTDGRCGRQDRPGPSEGRRHGAGVLLRRARVQTLEMKFRRAKRARPHPWLLSRRR